jgi:hypothetical protein
MIEIDNKLAEQALDMLMDGIKKYHEMELKESLKRMDYKDVREKLHEEARIEASQFGCCDEMKKGLNFCVWDEPHNDVFPELYIYKQGENTRTIEVRAGSLSPFKYCPWCGKLIKLKDTG